MGDIELTVSKILEFWFDEIPPARWFAKDARFDAELRRRFMGDYLDIQTGGHERYLKSAHSILAAVLLLDQFSRNLYRGDPRAYAEDWRAIALSRHAVDQGLDGEIEEYRRAFLYMPFMHSEDPSDHEQAVRLFSKLSDPRYLEFEMKHKAVIDRFGRYPHRNEVLGRQSTPQELEFIAEHGGF